MLTRNTGRALPIINTVFAGVRVQSIQQSQQQSCQQQTLQQQSQQ